MNDNEDHVTKNKEDVLEWTAPEHPHKHKTKEWKISVVVIGSGFVIGSIMLGNFVFALLSVAAVVSIFLVFEKPPKDVLVSISKKGVSIGSKRYPYVNIESFWVNELEEPPRLLLKTDSTFSPLVSIQLIDIDEDEVREKMIRHAYEEEMYEPFFQRLAEHLGI